MKNLFMSIYSIFLRQDKPEVWNENWAKNKYLLVLGHKQYKGSSFYPDDYYYSTNEFASKKEALDFLDEHISKHDRKKCVLYKELKIEE